MNRNVFQTVLLTSVVCLAIVVSLILLLLSNDNHLLVSKPSPITPTLVIVEECYDGKIYLHFNLEQSNWGTFKVDNKGMPIKCTNPKEK